MFTDQDSLHYGEIEQSIPRRLTHSQATIVTVSVFHSRFDCFSSLILSTPDFMLFHSSSLSTKSLDSFIFVIVAASSSVLCPPTIWKVMIYQ